MSQVSTNTPSGFRDFLPIETHTRSFMIEHIGKIYRKYGFQPISTPYIENLSTLTGKGGGVDNEKLIFKILKRGEDLDRNLQEAPPDKNKLSDLGLRFDLTLPLARYVARHRSELHTPFKAYHIGPLWRADRPQKGRYREFYQCDVDIVGSSTIGAEVEVLLAISEVLQFFNINDFEIHLNDRELLKALGVSLGVSEKEWNKALVSLDKLDKIGPEGVLEELTISKAQKDSLSLMLFQGKSDLSTLHPEAYTRLQQLTEILKSSNDHIEIVINPTLVRGQDYYTGTIFEIRHPELSGSIGGGGRYNKLLEIFGTPQMPCFGGSIGFERLFLLLTEKQKLTTLAPQGMMVLFSEELRSSVTQVAHQLRQAQISVEVYPDPIKLKNQFKYADDRKIPYVIIIGEDELKSKKAKVKDMVKHSEEEVPLDQLVSYFMASR